MQITHLGPIHCGEASTKRHLSIPVKVTLDISNIQGNFAALLSNMNLIDWDLTIFYKRKTKKLVHRVLVTPTQAEI